MILRVLFVFFLNFPVFIYTAEKFYFGVVNHHTQWYVHCPYNNTKLLNPPLHDQPLISYDCPSRSLTIEILPLEIDFTFLCRAQSRLIWIIVDIYQFNTFLWLIDRDTFDIHIELNRKIQVVNSTVESKNYSSRFILIDAFYMPFESMDQLLNEHIEINIQITNKNRLNRCTFVIRDNYPWKRLMNDECNSKESRTFRVQHAKCDFYTNKSTLVETTRSHQILHGTTNSTVSDISVVLSIEQHKSTTNPMPYYHRYLLLEEKYRETLTLLARSSINSNMLNLIFLFTLIILILLVIFFLYMLCYHYSLRTESTDLHRESSTLM